MDVTDLRLETRLLGGLPLVNVFYDRLGIDRLLDAHVPGDTRLRLAPSAALGVVIRNLVVRHAPVYALGEWASRYEATQVGLTGDEAELLNDDRVGRMLSRLFDADRASLLTRLVLDAVETFDIDLSRLHNDSTSLQFSGAYERADGHARGGKPTPAVTHGFSKDHRPDLKQLVWILTVSADGAVPIAVRIADWQHHRCRHPHRHVGRPGHAHRRGRVPLRRGLEVGDVRQRPPHPHPWRQVPVGASGLPT